MYELPNSLPYAEEMAPVTETVEPLRDWVLLQPSVDDERAGRIILPANVGAGRLQRSMILAAGEDVSGVAAGDIVLVAATDTLDLRDGSQLAPYEAIVARIQS